MKSHSFRSLIVVVSVLIWCHDGSAQQAVEDLSDSEKKAMAKIEKQRVTSTITFLASDELGGRGTGTEEYKIAAAYVAARFRGAGLTGGGKEGSFYQVAEIPSFSLPVSGIEFSGKTAATSYGLLIAGNQDVDFSGEIPAADPENRDDYKGPVVIEYRDEYQEPRGYQTLLRDVSRLRRSGATAVLLRTKADSPIVGIARQNQKRPQMGRVRASIPILLIEDKQLAAGKWTLKIPKRVTGKSKYRNVIGILKGSDAKLSKEAVMISAHLDHLGTRPGMADPIFNGADDNASGVTGVVSLADAFGSMEKSPKRTVIFIAWGGEEMGFQGSRFFTENPLWPLEKTVAMINLEMIGRPESGARNKAWGTGWDQSDLGDLLATGAKRAGTLIFQHPQYSGGRLYGASDNWPFVQKGVIAHSFSAGSLHGDYHQPSDETEKIEIDHMTAVIKGLFAGSLPIANGDLTPKKTGANEQSRK